MTLFFVSDTLDMTLEVNNKVAQGSRDFEIDFGGVRLRGICRASSDFHSSLAAGMWVHIAGSLFLYVVSERNRTHVFVVHGGNAEIATLEDALSFGRGASVFTVGKLRDCGAVEAVFLWDTVHNNYKQLTGEQAAKACLTLKT